MTPLLAATFVLIAGSTGLNVWTLLSLRRTNRAINDLQREYRRPGA